LLTDNSIPDYEQDREYCEPVCMGEVVDCMCYFTRIFGTGNATCEVPVCGRSAIRLVEYNRNQTTSYAYTSWYDGTDISMLRSVQAI